MGKDGKNIIKTNSDFLFIYEGTRSNPNGDPDMENKPRMDYDTKTNLVTDLRVKRNIREYLKDKGDKIFVDTLDDRKVPADKMLNYLIEEITGDEKKLNKLISEKKKLADIWNDLTKQSENDKKNYAYADLKEIYNKKKDSNEADQIKKIREQFPKLNNLLLHEIVNQNLIDIRMFGGAFAVPGFSRAYTGPIQINWGYSLHPVDLIKSNTIVTIMNDDASNMGKDYKLYYSLLAFHGTINKHHAQKTGLTQDDVKLFREAIINSVSYKPTRSKGDQYPMLYLELEYVDEYNCYLRDLRNFVKCTPDSKPIRSAANLTLDFSELSTLIKENLEVIKAIHLWKTPLLQKGYDQSKDLPDTFFPAEFYPSETDNKLKKLSFKLKKE